MSDAVVVTVEHGVGRVCLNRPNIHNAFDDLMVKQLTEAFLQMDRDRSVRVMILEARGKNFCAGGDLNWMKRMAKNSQSENLKDAQGLANMLWCLNTLSKPSIARVQGAAYGGAVGLVSCCDIAVGTHTARFCLSEVKIGLMPATISPYVIAAIGQRAARRYFLSAEVFDAQRALDLGLLSEVVDDSQIDESIQAICNSILANGPCAVAAAKKLVFDVAQKPIEDSLIADTSAWIAAIRSSDEGQEGLSAFLEKRKPVWQSDD
jgi:methylglutaconyl-CoA hydratase